MDDTTKKIVYWVLLALAVAVFAAGFLLDQTSIAGLVGVALILVAAFGFGPKRDRAAFWHKAATDE